MKKGWWNLNTMGVELNDVDREHIAELIKQGFTSGEVVQEVQPVLKTSNVDSFPLIKECFKAFCDTKGFVPYNNSVTFEHNQFCCQAYDDNDDYEDDRTFIAVDACCSTCEDSKFEPCPTCGRNNQIDFEEVS